MMMILVGEISGDDYGDVPVNPSLRLFIKDFERKPPALYDDMFGFFLNSKVKYQEQ